MSKFALLGLEGLTLLALIVALLFCGRLLARNAMLSAELRQKADTLRHAENLGLIGTWKIDVNSGKLHWSDRVFAIHGRKVSRGEPPLEDAIAYYDKEEREMVEAAVDRAMSEGVQFEFTASLLAEDGNVKNVLSRGMCACDSHGRVETIYGVFIETAHVIQLAEFVNDNGQRGQPDQVG